MTYQETIVPIMKGKNKGNKQYLNRLSIQAISTYNFGMLNIMVKRQTEASTYIQGK